MQKDLVDLKDSCAKVWVGGMKRWRGGKRCGFVESNMRREGEEFTSQAVAEAYLRRGRCLHD